MIDYFEKLLIDTERDGIEFSHPDVEAIWNNDVKTFREFSIKQNNGNVERGIDLFSLKHFLNHYQIAVNVLGLHSNLGKKKYFNQLIDMGWRVYNGDY